MILWNPQYIDVAKHAEIRMRRVFPVSWEAGLGERYQKALEEYQKQIEAEKQFWQLVAQASGVESRLTVWDWLKKNLSVLQEAISKGDYATFNKLFNDLSNEVETARSKDLEAYQTTLTNIQKTGGAYSPGYTPSSSGSNLTSSSVGYSQPPATQVFVGAKTGTAYVYNPNTGVLKDTSTGAGYSTSNPIAVASQLEGAKTQTTATPASVAGYSTKYPESYTTKTTTPASLFGGSTFYNPFR